MSFSLVRQKIRQYFLVKAKDKVLIFGKDKRPGNTLWLGLKTGSTFW